MDGGSMDMSLEPVQKIGMIIIKNPGKNFTLFWLTLLCQPYNEQFSRNRQVLEGSSVP
jgi:hypothetical protein